MIDITEADENIYQIDEQLYGIPRWGSIYVLQEEKKALVDTGPTSSSPVVLAGIKQLGLAPSDIDYLIVTHIHLDHGGGAGTLLREMPHAQVLVHERGARHMVNPERLIQSKIAAQGKDAMARDGEMVPIAADRVKPVRDGDRLELGDGQVLEFMDAPGHAQHELCIYETRNRGVFTGDGAGLCVTRNRVILPSTPVPNFDYEKEIDTLQRLMARNASQIYFGHFGANPGVRECLESVLEIMRRWYDLVMTAARERNIDGLAERMIALKLTELETAKKDNAALYHHLSTVFLASSVDGFLKYCRDKNLLH